MSGHQVQLVKSRIVGSVTRKAILLVLADYADANWSTFVGQTRLAAESETSERTVRRTLADFQVEGLIEREHRYRPNGTRTSDRLKLVAKAIADLPASLAGGVDYRPEEDDLPPMDDLSTGQSLAGSKSELPDMDALSTGHSLAASDVDYRPNTHRLPATDDRTTGHSLAGEHLEEQKERTKTLFVVTDVTPRATAADAADTDPATVYFDAFWRAYPKRTARKAATKAYKAALKDTTADVINAAAVLYASSVRGKDPKYIPHPTTWLNQGRWEDEPTEPEQADEEPLPLYWRGIQR